MASLTFPITGIDIGLTVAPLAMLAGDPTLRLTQRCFARATWTPHGPAAIELRWGNGCAEVQAHGQGADWLADKAEGLLGGLDDPSTFHPPPGLVRNLWSRHPGLRIPRTSTVWHDLAWTIVQQRVRRAEAANNWRRLTQVFGQPAPGIAALRTPPAPEALARTSVSDLRRLGLDGVRARALIESARVAHRLHPLSESTAEEALPKLSSIRGIGPWTTSCLAAFTWGDPDTVIVGDAGIPSLIASALAGERRADDERMLELLAPHRPHRYRVLRLLFAQRLGR